MLLNNYLCPQCRMRLTRVSKWLGYCCETCKLAVTLLGSERARVTPITGKEPSIIALSELVGA